MSGRSGSRALRSDLVDAAALEVYGLVREGAWLADRALEKVLRREKRLYAVERRAVAEAVYGLLRSQGLLEWLLGARPGGRADLATLYALSLARTGAAAPEVAAKRLGISPRVVAAALDRAGERVAAIPDPVTRLAVEASLPRWIAERFVSELGEDEARLLCRALNVRAPLTVRANLLKATREELAERLEAEGVEAVPTRHSPWGLVLDGHANAFALASFADGLFEIQDEGSQLIALAVGARPGWKVVDACAGAGGKALALAMEMHGKGDLVALDPDAERLDEARRRARRAGVHNLRARQIPPGAEADAALQDLAGACERVLVDAPCSGLGTLRRKPDARWRLKQGDPERFAALQKELVARFAKLAKKGARLVYATCAVGRTENAEVAAFAEREVGLAPFPLEAALPAGLAAALGGAANTVQLLPHRHGTDGFFISAFEKR
ncbi:MAG: RsmB/NOP family class I SAM-dependent RNA methyltransferase [Anaeromyxobacteraceae bacterium]